MPNAMPPTTERRDEMKQGAIGALFFIAWVASWKKSKERFFCSRL